MTDRNVRKRAGETVGGLLTRFERNIADGLWQVGTKIPTERELEQELGVSRNTLRKGLRQLEEQGRIER
ncbi:MAG: GntR family transcriptional regulator, partial [Sphingobium sp.]